MSAITPKIRPAHLPLIAAIVLLGAFAASPPAAAQPFDLALSVRSLTAWIEGLGLWPAAAERSDPLPNAGTCIDPNGKPRPCDGAGAAPPGAPSRPADSAPGV
jgi:hypothetical protein